PASPPGAGIAREELQRIIAAARNLGAVVASDECYAELPWTPAWVESGVPSLLADEVTGGDHEGLLAAYSLSKQSNLAGYRAAFVAGDQDVIAKISLLRRHLGMMIPAPVQEVMVRALSDDEHVSTQREVYHRRRELLIPALGAAGFTIEDSEAGLYLWVRREDTDGWQIVADFAAQGIIVGPGSFYGEAASSHVRTSLTASDERVRQAAARLAQ